MGTLRIFIVLCVFTAFISMETYGQVKLDGQTVTDLQKTPKYAFGVSDEFHFKGVLGMYDALVENGVDIEAFEIVVKGKIVSDLVKGSALESYFEKYQGKVRVSVCSMAMKKLDVTADQLFEGLTPVPTASIRMLQLQANGYNTLSY
ncbi:DsrE family protein [Flagellimonas pelagia]|uniref:Uncharacterized protein n=1 Tax=Flagellimonas pelagia TaxID=2306998 RepID=A0A3A1NMM7_9FLAO|nr:DsrE family protein [Allomuricauda maritima]RIV46976.1 hypothetical protein D2V05_03190 [Allomuricauda maritima]TXJ99865.1 hypothetical protein FQ017_03175 [Allomuricauda maritima]